MKLYVQLIFLIFGTAYGNVVIPKIVDFFPFNGEPMAFLRLGYLMKVVDYFFIIESNVTHSGKPKSVIYLNKYADVINNLNATGKIRTHRCTFPPQLQESWSLERYQRNIGKELILDFMGNTPFVLIVSDADELVRKEFVMDLKTTYNYTMKPRHFILKIMKYSFKWHQPHFWDQGYVINDYGLRQSTQTLSEIRMDIVHHAEIKKESYWWNAGWHCTFCFKITDIIRKLRSFAHTEYSYLQVERSWIIDRVNEGKDILNRTDEPYRLYDGTIY
jgi:hypothetical protein